MARTRPLRLFLLGLFALGASPALADRPLTTEEAETLKKGVIVLELAFDYLRDSNHNNNNIPSTQLRYGLLERGEIGASIGYIDRDVSSSGKVDGWSDLFVYFKYWLWEEGEYDPSVAFKSLVKFPTASRGKEMGSGKIDYGIGPIFSKSYSDFRFHFDALYLFTGEKDKNDILSTGVALEYDFLKGWAAVGEVRYANNFNSNHQDDPLLANFGLKKEVGRAVFDAAFSVGLNHAAPDYGFTVGVTIGF